MSTLPSLTEVTQIIYRYAPAQFMPKVGLILGSGLSTLANQITHPTSIPYQAISGLPASNVAGHASMLLLGYLANVPVACLRGRLHHYEGIDYQSIRLLVRALRYLGCQIVVMTGAVGSLQANMLPGDLVLLTDHINLHPGNPLRGPNDESIGPRFISLEDAYDPILQEVLITTAARLHIPLHKGIYVCTLGPSFETPAEIRAYKTLGGDVVGMSIAPEVIIARHCGLRVAALTAITNFAAGMNKEKITHEGTLHIAEQTVRKLDKLIPAFLSTIAEQL